MFHEYSEQGQSIMTDFEIMMNMLSRLYDFSFRSPVHDVSRRFLNEIKEFESVNGKREGRIGDR